MSTSIQWTDAVWNPVTGCTKVSAGCAHCYAETFAHRQMGPWKGRAFSDVRCHEDRLDQPLHWRRPRRVFVNSMSDLFHETVPDAFIDWVFAVMALCPQHTFQVLTKRPQRMRDYFSNIVQIAQGAITHERVQRLIEGMVLDEASPLTKFARMQIRQRVVNWNAVCAWPLPNVWLGVSCEDQNSLEARWPPLAELAAHGWKTFCSAEPLLGRLDLTSIESTQNMGMFFDALRDGGGALSWVIVGGESGLQARPCDVAWIRSIVEQCRSAGVPVFVKQLGARPVEQRAPLAPGCGTQFAVSVRNRKGGDPDEWPEALRVRESPEIGR